MKGLLKNNLYATFLNAKLFSCFMILFGIFAVVVVSQSVQISYAMIGMMGFSVSAVMITKNEFNSKWGKYKLILPVKRADIVKSLFLNHLIWLFAGILFTGVELSLSWFFHGCLFDKEIDILSMFALGISMSLFMGAIFFPMLHIGGEERGVVCLMIALLCAFGIDFVIISIINDLLEPELVSIIFGEAVLVGCSFLAFGISCLFTVHIFQGKEY